MEPKKSSAQSLPQPRAATKKSPPRAAADAAAAGVESPLSSLFQPTSHGVNGKEQDLYAILFKGQNGSAQATSQMVNPSGVLLKVERHTPRKTNNRTHMTRLVRHLALVLLCTMVAETIMAALHLSNPRNTMITSQLTRIQSQILTATGGKDHLTTKQAWCPLPSRTRKSKGRC